MNELVDGPRELAASEKVTAIGDEQWHEINEAKKLVETKSGHVLITVRDSGPGVEPHSLEHLFDAFYTTKPQGLGMGLAISRFIIEAHGGPALGRSQIRAGLFFNSLCRFPTIIMPSGALARLLRATSESHF